MAAEVWHYMALLEKSLSTLGWVVAAIVTSVIGYFIGRQQTVDKIQLETRHRLAGELVSLLRRDYHNRQFLRRAYADNFSHLKNVNEAVSAFEKYSTLYIPMRQAISQIPDDLSKLGDLGDRASLCMNRKTIAAIDSYIATTNFSYATDGGLGLVNEHDLRFFENLTNEDKFTELTALYDDAIRRLRASTRAFF